MQVPGFRKSPHLRRCRTRRWLALGLVVAASGCFVSKYEERLYATRLLYEHFDLLFQNLSATWKGPGVIQLRVPLNFVEIPAPAPEVAAPVAGAEDFRGDGGAPVNAPAEAGDAVLLEGKTPVRASLDERQPVYLNLELPGLIGAWRCPIRARVQDGVVDRSVYCYVLSNYNLFLVPDSDQDRLIPEKFTEIVTKRIEEALKLKMGDTAFIPEKYPMGFDLVPKVSYLSITLQPSMPIEDVNYKIQVYFNNKGAIQVIILFVIPEGTDAPEVLQQRIALCLETLRTEDLPPAGAGSIPADAPKGF